MTEARQPKSASEVRSFVGFMSFFARFIPGLASISEPLGNLSRRDVPFHWDKEQSGAFTELKKRLANTKPPGYYSKDAKTRLVSDTLLFSRSRFNSKKGVKKKVQNDFGVKFPPVLLTPSEE